MTETNLTAYYEGSSAYSEMLQGQDDAVFAAYVELFRRHVPVGGRVVDVGCGTGTSTRLLRAAGYEATGTDLPTPSLPDEEGFRAVDFQDAADLGTGSFDAAGAMNVLEHIPRPRAFLAEMLRVVRPGGHVVLTSPNLTSPLAPATILRALRRGETPYLGVQSERAALALLGRNLWRSARARAGREAFEPRSHTVDTGIVGYDVDAVYWTNALEVRRFLERRGARTVAYQTEARSRAADVVRRLAPSLAGQLVVVVEKTT